MADLVARLPLHHRLLKDGWSVLAYEAHPLGREGSGEAEAAKLRQELDRRSRELAECRDQGEHERQRADAEAALLREQGRALRAKLQRSLASELPSPLQQLLSPWADGSNYLRVDELTVAQTAALEL